MWIPMITYKKIEPQTVELWNQDGFFARVNEYEFYDIRVQVQKQQAEGWYVVFEGLEFPFNKDAKLEYWPKGMFDMITDYLMELI